MSEPIDDGYPIVVRLEGRSVLVVGGAQIALRKASGLAAAGARLTVISPDVLPELEALATTVHRRCYEPGDLVGHLLVVAATNDPEAQQQIFDEGERLGIFVNAVDDPDRCSFILPAIARRGPVIVAVSAQGRSPSLAGRLRDLLADALPDDIEAIAAELAERRRQIRAAGGSTEDVEWPDPLAGRGAS